MSTDVWPEGLLTALVTPLRDGQVDVAALHALVDRQVEAGVSGFVVGGGTGEFGALSVDERQLLAAESLRAVGGRLPVVVQTGALSTTATVTLSRHAERIGAAALLVASPFGEPISWRERWRFYEVVTASTELPVMIYNTPPAGLLDLTQVQQLAELPHVGAIKDSSGDAALMGDLLAWSGGRRLAVYVGMDSLLYDAMGAGASGAVFGAANLVPEPLVAIVRALRAGERTANVAELWRQVRPLLRFMEGSANYVALCKAGLALQGLDVGAVREPYLMPEPDEAERLRRHLERVAGAFDNSDLSRSAQHASSSP